MEDDAKLEEVLEKLGETLDQAARFLPPHLRDQLTLHRRDLKKRISRLEQQVEDGCGCGFCDPYDRVTPLEGAQVLSDWARQEDPRTVGKALDAIRGGHVSDLSLIF